jgi:fluoride exporter
VDVRHVAVFVGGAVGSLARWGLGFLFEAPAGAFPYATFVANITGAFGLAVLGVWLTERLPPTVYLRPLVGIGFFGAYTTFSIMAFEGVALLEDGYHAMAFTYWALTLLVGVTAGVAGMWVGRVRPFLKGGRT